MKQDLAALLPGLTGGIKVALDNTAAYWDSNTKNFGYESAVLNLETGEKNLILMPMKVHSLILKV